MSGEWQGQDLHQTMKSQQTFHTLPSEKIYGVSLIYILQKNDTLQICYIVFSVVV